jgi:L-rhamnose mutarotase
MKPAIIVPYKNRKNYLDIFLNRVPKYIEGMNGIQNYAIYLAEQTSSDIFNLSLSRNVGAMFALADSKFDYLIFHDVDVIPIENIDYGPRDYNVAWFMTAGTCKVHISAYIKANGYNPRFVGWGAEDKEFYHRLSTLIGEVKEWHRTGESRHAVIMDLGMPRLSEAEALRWSKGYFGYTDDGPRYIPCNDLVNGLPHQPYDKSKDFMFPEYQKRNDQIWERVYHMPLGKKLEYIKANGMNLVHLSGISVKERVGKLVWLTYKTNMILADR